VLPLSEPELVIGNSDSADIVLEDEFVSRRHALITVADSGPVTIHDLNSTGGTFVNNERLTGPRQLQPGDLVRFANFEARFEAPELTAGSTDPARARPRRSSRISAIRRRSAPRPTASIRAAT
jgi:pSer/pThr/pTyr-binding forkhead associated (FHA) protein